MSDHTTATRASDDARLAEIVEVVVAIARNDFSTRASVGDGSHLLDGLATGLNMLAEEVGKRHDLQAAYQQRMLQNERLLAVGQLAAGVAHEICNPAAYVLTNLETQQRDFDQMDRVLQQVCATQDPDAMLDGLATLHSIVVRNREFIRDNTAGIERIVNIVRELRNFSRSEGDQLEALDLDDVIAEASKLVRAEVSYRARFEIHSRPGSRIFGDMTRLTQVFTNLLINAAQAIPEGDAFGNCVHVATRLSASTAYVTVSDTGLGLSDEAQRRLFEPFFTTKTRNNGMGLGLAISGDIVRHHGGELRLVSTSPTGTVFEVQLPLDASIHYLPVNISAHVASHDRAKVLLIDDEALLLTAYARSVRDIYDLTTASSGREAIAVITERSDWDAIVCDVMMPDLDGLAVFEWVHAHRPALAERMLFFSGGAFTARSQAFAERLGDRLLHKPIALDALRQAIERVRSSSAGRARPGLISA